MALIYTFRCENTEDDQKECHLNCEAVCSLPLYRPAHNTYKRQTSMPLAGFEPATLASDRPQILALERKTYTDRNIFTFSRYFSLTSLLHSRKPL